MELIDLIKGLEKGSVKILIPSEVIFEISVNKDGGEYKVYIEPKVTGELVSCEGKIEITLKPMVYRSEYGGEEISWADALRRVLGIIRDLVGSKVYYVKLDGNFGLKFDYR
jgi:hypothetical protein